MNSTSLLFCVYIQQIALIRLGWEEAVALSINKYFNSLTRSADREARFA